MRFKRSATKRGFRVQCHHRLIREGILRDKKEWFITKRQYRRIWKDSNLYRRWFRYSRYLAYRNIRVRANHAVMYGKKIF